MSSHEALEQAIQAIQSGDKDTGRRLLAQVLRADPTNVEAWLWMSDSVDSDEQRRDCLQHALALDPQNLAAQSRLANLPAAATDMRTEGPIIRGTSAPDYAALLATQRAPTVAAPSLTQAQRKRGYRNIMLSGALLLSLVWGLVLLIYTVTAIVPQAQERMKPTPETALYDATLWCLPCEQAGSQIVLWEKVGDGISRGGKTGELPHDTWVSVLAEEWSEPEERVYYKVTAHDQTGWVPDTFIRR